VLNKYYPISTPAVLRKFIDSYIPLVFNQIENFKIPFKKFNIHGDHLGLQTISADEFDLVNDQLQNYSTLVKAGEIHNRRNNIYKLNNFVESGGIQIQSVEVFEPKPGANISKLKPGFEHIAIKVDEYEKLVDFFDKNNLPIDKSSEFNGSKFFKTKLINMIEIEFRNDFLWKVV